jgi:hypothetical protein
MRTPTGIRGAHFPKKSKGIGGEGALLTPTNLTSNLSPQQKGSSPKKRVMLHSPPPLMANKVASSKKASSSGFSIFGSDKDNQNPSSSESESSSSCCSAFSGRGASAFSVETVAMCIWAEDMVAAVAHILPALNMWTYPKNLCLLRLAATLHPPAPLPNKSLERFTILGDPCRAQASLPDYPVLWTQVFQWHTILKQVTPLKTLIQTRSHGGSGPFLARQTLAPLKGPHPSMPLTKPPGLVCGLDKRVLLFYLVLLHFIFKGTGGHISSLRCGQTLGCGTILTGLSISMNGMPVYWMTVEGNWPRWQAGDMRRQARAIGRADGGNEGSD